MKNRIKNSSRIILLLLIPAVMWCWYSDFSNKHFHMLPDGSIIVHSHPYEADGSDGPVQSHEHSDAMLNLLFIVSSSTKVILPALVSVIFFLILIRKQQESFNFHRIFNDTVFARTYRGPPVLN